MRRLPWLLLALFVLAVLASSVLLLTTDAEGDAWLMLLLAGYATVGAMIASRQPRNAVGWLLLGVALTFALQGFGEVYAAVGDAPAGEYVGWAASWSWYLWMALTGIFLPLVFPTGRVLGPRWRLVVWLGVAAVALSAGGSAFRAGELDLSAPVTNPFGATGTAADVVAVVADAGNVLTALAFVLAGLSLALRFRRARGVERAQLKWFALVGVLVVVSLSLAMTEVLVPGGWRRVIGTIGWFSFLFLAILGIPAATGIAILRHRLYDIDVVIRRTLVYGALTATLAAVYLGLVLLSGLTVGDSDVAIAGATLFVAWLARPVLGRIQEAVDRRFYRRRYDAARTLEQFGTRLRDELDLEALAADLRGVVADTVQPAHVSLWLRGGR